MMTNSDGREFVHTSVRIPKTLYDQAVERRISMSATLTKALEKECGGEKLAPTSEPRPHRPVPGGKGQ